MSTFDRKTLNEMVKDACFLERMDKSSLTNRSAVYDVCIYVKALASEVERLHGENILAKEQLAAVRKLITGEDSKGNFLDDATIIYAWVRRRMDKAAAEVEEQLRKCHPQNPDAWR